MFGNDIGSLNRRIFDAFQVREYGAKAEAVRSARKAAQDASGGSEQLEADVQALFDEMQTQRQILDKCARPLEADRSPGIGPLTVCRSAGGAEERVPALHLASCRAF